MMPHIGKLTRASRVAYATILCYWVYALI